MAKLVKTIHDRINFAIKKGLTGYISPDKIDTEINTESMNLWLKYEPMFERDATIAAFLDPFKRSESVTITAGEGTMTAAYTRPTGVFDSAGKKIEIVDIAMWGDRINHPLKTPSTDYPVCRFENRKIIIRPTTITPVTVHYLKYPTKVVYAYTLVGTRYVYDDTNSVDTEWPEILHDQITERVLANLGINMRETVLVQYSQQEKQQEGK